MHYTRLQRAIGEELAEGPLVFMASTPGPKRDGIDTAALPWRVDNFRLNPVVTWSHDFDGKRLPIGRAEVEVIDTSAGEYVRAAITFDRADPFAAEVERKYRDGFLHAVSVSWDDIDASGTPVRAVGGRAAAHELLEIAAVPVPGDPLALQEKRADALRSMARELIAAIEDASAADDGSETPGDCQGCGECAVCEAATADAPDDSCGGPKECEECASKYRADYTISYSTGTGPSDTLARATPANSRMDQGSYEYTAELLREAAKTIGLFPGARWLWVLSTHPDYVVFTVEYDDAQSRSYRVGYAIAGEAVSFVGTPEEVSVTHSIVIRGQGRDRANATTTDDEDAGDDVAAEMVAVFDPASDDSDAARARRYRALLPAYRRLGWTAPELLPVAELALMDADVWRGLFVSGELERVERAGKELSTANLTTLRSVLDQLSAAVDTLNGLVARVDSGADRAEELPSPDDIARAILDSVTARIERA